VTSSFSHPYQGTVLWDSSPSSSRLRLRGFHPLWRAVSGYFGFASEKVAGPATLHSPCVSAWSSVWTFPFSLAATGGIPIWFLFLPLLRCFRSGGSRSFLECHEVLWELVARSLIRVSPDLRLRAATRGVSPLAAPFFGAQA
jgi:hypothetical protein